MLSNTNKLKIILRKYLPSIFFDLIYNVYIFITSFFSKDKSKIPLTHFKKSTVKDISINNINFKLKIDPNNGTVDKEIFLYGVYEPHILKIIEANINKNSICLDIGANIGQHTMLMASVVKEGEVHSFEPLKNLCDQIVESKNINNFNNIFVNNFGLSDKESVMTIYKNNLNIGKTSLIKSDYTDAEDVYIKMLDTFWKDNNKDKKIDFVKIDVEGYEYQVLLGMEEIINKYKPKILFEYSPVFYKDIDIKGQDIIIFLLNKNYKIYDVENNGKEITKVNLETFIKVCDFQTNLLCK